MSVNPIDQETATQDAWQGCSKGVQQTEALGQAVAQHAQHGDMIALVGELGAGKTQLVRGLAKGMGIDPREVSSPTFVIMQQYTHPHQDAVLLHVDAYRLNSFDDLHSLGWDTDVFDDALVVVEWAGRLTGQLPDNRLEIRLAHDGPDQRGITIIPHGASWTKKMADLCPVLKKTGMTITKLETGIAQ